MYDIPGFTEEDHARDRFLNYCGVAMIGLFALCNLLLGFGEPSTVDDFVLNLVGGVVDRPWTLL